MRDFAQQARKNRQRQTDARCIQSNDRQNYPDARLLRLDVLHDPGIFSQMHREGLGYVRYTHNGGV